MVNITGKTFSKKKGIIYFRGLKEKTEIVEDIDE